MTDYAEHLDFDDSPKKKPKTLDGSAYLRGRQAANRVELGGEIPNGSASLAIGSFK